jgi:hypothetical protein
MVDDMLLHQNNSLELRTIVLAYAWHQPGISLVNETSPIFRHPLLVINCGSLPTPLEKHESHWKLIFSGGDLSSLIHY